MPKKKVNNIIKSIGALFDVMSHPDRIKIIYLLKDREMDVNEIHDAVEISQSRTSQHLKLLKFHSVVEERKDGKHVFYKLKNRNITKVMQTALQFQLVAYSAEPETINLISELLKSLQI